MLLSYRTWPCSVSTISRLGHQELLDSPGELTKHAPANECVRRLTQELLRSSRNLQLINDKPMEVFTKKVVSKIDSTPKPCAFDSRHRSLSFPVLSLFIAFLSTLPPLSCWPEMIMFFKLYSISPDLQPGALETTQTLPSCPLPQNYVLPMEPELSKPAI